MPVLDRSRTALKGCVVHLQWSIPNGLLNIGPEPFVRAHVAAALHVLGDQGPDDRVVVVGKSVGGYAAALAAERGLPAIWLTPLLHDHELVDAIAATPLKPSWPSKRLQVLVDIWPNADTSMTRHVAQVGGCVRDRRDVGRGDDVAGPAWAGRVA